MSFCLGLNYSKQILKNKLASHQWLFRKLHQPNTFFNKHSSAYMNDVLKLTGHRNTSTRTSILKLNQPFWKTNHGQKPLLYFAINIWSCLGVSLKPTEDINIYPSRIKKSFFSILNIYTSKHKIQSHEACI